MAKRVMKRPSAEAVYANPTTEAEANAVGSSLSCRCTGTGMRLTFNYVGARPGAGPLIVGCPHCARGRAYEARALECGDYDIVPRVGPFEYG